LSYFPETMDNLQRNFRTGNSLSYNMLVNTVIVHNTFINTLIAFQHETYPPLHFNLSWNNKPSSANKCNDNNRIIYMALHD
jgi:hypothetical protein